MKLSIKTILWVALGLAALLWPMVVAFGQPMPPVVETGPAEPELVNVTFAWDPSPDKPVTYTLCWGTNELNVGTNLTTTLALEMGTSNLFWVVAVGTNQTYSVPSNSLAVNPRWEPWIVVQSELLQSDSVTGPWLHTGQSRIAITNTPAGQMRFWGPQASVKEGRELRY